MFWQSEQAVFMQSGFEHSGVLPIQILVRRRSALSEKAPDWCRTRGNVGDSMKIMGVKAAKMQLKYVGLEGTAFF
jgi:hypothetical protein